MLASGCTHCVIENSYPKRNDICAGASIMLLMNFIAEWKITNGSIGIVRKIINHQPQG